MATAGEIIASTVVEAGGMSLVDTTVEVVHRRYALAAVAGIAVHRRVVAANVVAANAVAVSVMAAPDRVVAVNTPGDKWIGAANAHMARHGVRPMPGVPDAQPRFC
jgi:hypothetical protein